MILFALLAAGALAPLTVRYGEANLTPPELLPLGGYTARREEPFQAGGDALKAKAIVFEQGKLMVALISAELLTIPESLYREVKKRLPKELNLVLVASHTHCAPDSQMLNDRMTFKVPGISAFKRRWLDWYAERIASSAISAMRETRMPTTWFGMDRWLVDLNRGRRQSVMADPMATALSFPIYEDMACFVVHYSAHPVFYGPEEMHMRSDFPGAIARDKGLFLPGAIGDVSPKAPGNTPAERILNFAKAFFEAEEKNGIPPTTPNGPRGRALEANPFRWVETPIELGEVKAHPNFARDNGVPDALADSLVSMFAPKTASIAAFRLGKLAIVGVPGEPTAALGRRIHDFGKRLGFTWVLVVSHVNGWIGYVLESDDYDRGGYEATLSFHGRETGERVYEASAKALKALAVLKP